MKKRIHIFGASGAGVSTLGYELSKNLDVSFFDADDFYWKKTDPPYQEPVEVERRKSNLLQVVNKHNSWVLSGSLVSWGGKLEKLFDLAVYLYVPSDIRISRLKKREKLNHGDRVKTGGDMHTAHLKFLNWAKGYDHGSFNGRSKSKHLDWMNKLKCPLLKFEGVHNTEYLVEEIKKYMRLDNV